MPDVEPPESDEVKFNSISLKLTPAAFEKIVAVQTKSHLTRARTMSMLINAGHAALSNDTGKIKQWQDYYAKAQAAAK